MKRLIYKTNKYKKYKQINIFNNMKLIKSFDGSIYVGKITTDEAEEDQSNLLKIQQNLLKNPYQEQKKVKIKKKYL